MVTYLSMQEIVAWLNGLKAQGRQGRMDAFSIMRLILNFRAAGCPEDFVADGLQALRGEEPDSLVLRADAASSPTLAYFMIFSAQRDPQSPPVRVMVLVRVVGRWP